MSRVLVVGWFSFDEVIATVGDERGAEVVSDWLREAGVAHDVAWAGYLGRARTLADVDPADYTHLLFVCGPLLHADLLDALLTRFARCRRLAVGVSVVEPDVAARFDEVWTRDGAGGVGPDLAVLPAATSPTVVALVFAPPQAEYGTRGRHEQVRAAVQRWVSDRALGWFEVETDVYTGSHDVRHASQVAAALGRADVVVTSRLHGLVLGLGQGRPVLAIDPVLGGAKVAAQAEALRWPVVLGADEVGPTALDAALARCLVPDEGTPRGIGQEVRDQVADVRRGVLAAVGADVPAGVRR